MADRDANKEALDQVEHATESEPVKGDDLVGIVRGLKRQLREAKERLNAEANSASSRSSRPEKFVSRFFARFTFFSVSVTVYGALAHLAFGQRLFVFPPLLVLALKKYISFLLTILLNLYILFQVVNQHLWQTKDSPKKSRL